MNRFNWIELIRSTDHWCWLRSIWNRWNREWIKNNHVFTLRVRAACSWVACLRSWPLTEMIWSPRRKCPLASAGPPAKMNEMKMPSPSSPPTMLNPSPVVPFSRTTERAVLFTTKKNKKNPKSFQFYIHFLFHFLWLETNFYLNFRVIII